MFTKTTSKTIRIRLVHKGVNYIVTENSTKRIDNNNILSLKAAIILLYILPKVGIQGLPTPEYRSFLAQYFLFFSA